MTLPFLDTNVILRHLLADHPDHSPRATAYLSQIEGGKLRARTTDTVIFETVFTLERYYHVPRSKIREALMLLLQLPGIVLPGKKYFREVFELYLNSNLSFADAYHAVLMKRLKLDTIVSFDKQFDRVPSLKRIEPSK